MDEEKYQKNLFEFDQPKKSFSRLADMLPRADFGGRVAITISLEKIVFISIGIMMVMVIVYALGVESGRSRVAPAIQAAKPVLAPRAVSAPQERAVTISPKNILNTAPIAPVTSSAPIPLRPTRGQSKTAFTGERARPYTVLASTFSKVENAQAAAALLVKQGFNATITYAKPYYQVCIGAYADKISAEAERDLARVRRIFKDAMFKLR